MSHCCNFCLTQRLKSTVFDIFSNGEAPVREIEKKLPILARYIIHNHAGNNSLYIADFCDVGTYSHDGLVPCTTCKIGYYQNQMSSQSCQRCPQNTATWRRGAKSIQECQRKYITSLPSIVRSAHCKFLIICHIVDH